MSIGRVMGLAAWMVFLPGCAAIHEALDKLVSGFEDAPVVEAIDPAYQANAPQSPYAGPYPGNSGFDITAFDAEFPVAIGTPGPIDTSRTPQQPFGCETEEAKSELKLGQPIADVV